MFEHPDSMDQPIPPFPSDVPTAKLSKLSLRKLVAANEEESQKLFESCRTLGFFLLDLEDSHDGIVMLRDVLEMFKFAVPLFDLDTDTKMRYLMKDGAVFGYKAIGISKVDNKETPARCELWGFSKDHIIGLSAPEEAPAILGLHRRAVRSFVEHAHFICMHILSHLDKHLHLAPGTLAALHRLHRSSTDQVRLLKLSPQPESDRRTSLPHTDFGSVTLLWNYLGGFQILRPESQVDEECWEFVEPEPGCAVVNMGDAMVKFSNGVVRSNLHRVANAPGEQAVMGNHSLGYFSRPSNKVLMKALSGGENKSSSDKHAKGQENRIYTMKEWVAKREELYRKGVEPRQSTGGMAGMAIA